MAKQAIVKDSNGRVYFQYYGTTPNGDQLYEGESSSPHKLSFDLEAVRTFSSNENTTGFASAPYLDIKIASSAILFYYSKDTVVIESNTTVLDTSDATKTFADFDATVRAFLGKGEFPTIP